MISLRSSDLALEVNPQHGGEVTSLIDRPSGKQLLARPPFEPDPPRAGGLEDEETWCRSYVGGWQIVTPNAGNACTWSGRRYGFHGAASNSPWQVTSERREGVSMTWHDRELEVRRSISLDGSTVEVETMWRATKTAAPVLAVEHVAVGQALLSPAVQIELPGGHAFQQSESDGPVTPPRGAPRWPRVRMRDGSIIRGDGWSITETRAHVVSVADLPEGWAEVTNPPAGIGLRLEWDVARLPHLWLWHEVRGSGGLWRNTAEILGIEPASVPHGLGLADAISAGQAIFVEPGRDWRLQMKARVLQL